MNVHWFPMATGPLQVPTTPDLRLFRQRSEGRALGGKFHWIKFPCSNRDTSSPVQLTNLQVFVMSNISFFPRSRMTEKTGDNIKAVFGLDGISLLSF